MQFKPKHVYQVIGFNQNLSPACKKMLIEMGFLPGTSFRILRSAPFGEPYQISLRQKLWTVRSKLLQAINCTEVPQCATAQSVVLV